MICESSALCFSWRRFLVLYNDTQISLYSLSPFHTFPIDAEEAKKKFQQT